jgi:hypothetical protein
MHLRWWHVALAAVMVVVLGVAIGLSLATRGALERVERRQVLIGSASKGGDDDDDDGDGRSSRRSVTTYSVLVDPSAAAQLTTAPPPAQGETQLFACGATAESESSAALPVTTPPDSLCWLVLRATDDALALYADVANQRVRYLAIAGVVVRAWAAQEPQREPQQEPQEPQEPQRERVTFVIGNIARFLLPGGSAPTACGQAARLEHSLPFAAINGGTWEQLVAGIVGVDPHANGPAPARPFHIWGFA